MCVCIKICGFTFRVIPLFLLFCTCLVSINHIVVYVDVVMGFYGRVLTDQLWRSRCRSNEAVRKLEGTGEKITGICTSQTLSSPETSNAYAPIHPIPSQKQHPTSPPAPSQVPSSPRPRQRYPAAQYSPSSHDGSPRNLYSISHSPVSHRYP